MACFACINTLQLDRKQLHCNVAQSLNCDIARQEEQKQLREFIPLLRGVENTGIYFPDAATLDRMVDSEFELFFEEFAGDKKGRLNGTKIESVLIELIEVRKMETTTGNAEEVLKSFDYDGDEELNIEEFRNWMHNECSERKENLLGILGSNRELDKIISRMFQSASGDDDMSIDFEEMQKFLAEVSIRLGEEPPTREHAEKTFAAIAKSRKSKQSNLENGLSYKEFGKLIKPKMVKLLLQFHAGNNERGGAWV